ncbi:MAG: hypothetical protein ABSC00_01990 [Acidimicrobiales bacterium]
MSEQRVTRWMGPLGLAILVLLLLGFVGLSGGSPGGNASGASVVSYYNGHQSAGWAQVYLVGLALGLMVLFVTQLREVLRGAEGRRSFLPNAVFAAGIVFVAGAVSSGVFVVAILLAAHNHQPGIAQTLNFISSNDGLPLLFGMALLTLTTGAAILNRSSLPRWLGWLSVAIGVVTVAGPLSWFGFMASGIWLPVLGFVIASKSKTIAKPSVTDRPPAMAVR